MFGASVHLKLNLIQMQLFFIFFFFLIVETFTAVNISWCSFQASLCTVNAHLKKKYNHLKKKLSMLIAQDKKNIYIYTVHYCLKVWYWQLFF